MRHVCSYKATTVYEVVADYGYDAAHKLAKPLIREVLMAMLGKHKLGLCALLSSVCKDAEDNKVEAAGPECLQVCHERGKQD